MFLNYRHVNPILIAAALLISPLTAGAQEDYQAPSTLHGKTMVIPRGTVFEGRMDETIGSRSQQGAKFTISMASPLLANGTDVVVPAGAQVLGEIVEAISSDHVKHEKGRPKPTGKLRVQLSALRTPDGVTYPLVASLAGETYMSSSYGRQTPNSRVNQGIAYVGSQSSFEAVAPGAQGRGRPQPNGQGPKVVTREQMMKDPIYGMDRADQNNGGLPKIRSLVKRGRDLVLASGSPVTIRIDAPFKIGISQASAAASTLEPAMPVESDGSFGKRFAKTRGESQAAQDQQQNASSNPLPGILPDVPHGQTTTQPADMGGAPGAPQGQSPAAPQTVPVGNSPSSDF